MKNKNKYFILLVVIVGIVAIVGILNGNTSSDELVGNSFDQMSKEIAMGNSNIKVTKVSDNSLILSYKDDVDFRDISALNEFYEKAVNEMKKSVDSNNNLKDCKGNSLSKSDKSNLFKNMEENKGYYFYSIYSKAYFELTEKYKLKDLEARNHLPFDKRIFGSYNVNNLQEPERGLCDACNGGSHPLRCIGNFCFGGTVNIDGCLIEGTEISINNQETKKIEELKKGDFVLSYNFENNKYEQDEVLKIVDNGPKKFYLVNDKLRITADHKIYTENKGWIQVEQLQKGDKLRSIDDMIEVVRTKELNENSELRIYDISLKNNHNCFAEDYLVHNLDLGGLLTKPSLGGFEVTLGFSW
jgi:hypothetical protein